MRIRVLGSVEIASADGFVAAGTAKQRCVLAVLAMHPGQAVTTAGLIDRVWGEAPPVHARDSVYAHVSRLRRLLRDIGVPLRKTGSGYRLEVDPEEVDLHRARGLAKRARSCAEADDIGASAEGYRRALALWRDAPLTGIDGDWASRVRDGLERERLTLLHERFDVELILGRHAEVLAELSTLVSAYPMAEPLVGHLMVALYRCGRTVEALDCFTHTRLRLRDALGIDPGAALHELHRQMLRREPALLLAGEVRPSVPWEHLPGTADLPPGADDARPVEARVEPSARTSDLAAPRQLPADVVRFVNRASEIKMLDTVLDDSGQDPRTVLIAAISGMAGVGKTSLAVHWAHQVADRFPDGQLYVNLRGFDPDGPAMVPADAVRGFLDALGVAPERIPADLPAQSGLYRSLLARRRVLVVLDNARDAAQVRPLLPGGPGCLTVVTSRSQLAGLVATDGAHPVTVDVPTPAEARAMLTSRLGHQRTATESAAVDEIIAECARLPLALAIVAARAAIHPEFPLTAIAGQLRAARGGLDRFAGGDSATDVRAVFSWSYHTLRSSAARLFRMLGPNPGPDIAAPAAASLAGIPARQVGPLLAALTEAHLLTEHISGRYTFHDLLRSYATELTDTVDPEVDRRAALDRVLSHYLHSAYTAALVLHPIREPITVPPPSAGVTPEEVAEDHQALAWFAAERPVLLAAIRQAADHGLDDLAAQLAWTLSDFLQRQGHWSDLAATQRIALAAAQRVGDPARQADAHRTLGFAYARLRRRDAAVTEFQQALDRYRAVGDHLGRGKTHLGLGFVLEREGRHREALEQARLALAGFRDAGDRTGQARALNSYGWCYSLLGDHRQALVHCQRALTLQREGRDHRGVAYTLDSLGYIHHQLGDYKSAISCYEEAIELLRQADDRYYEADVLHHLGNTHHALDQTGAAAIAWRQALTILDQLDHPDADTIRAKLKPDVPPSGATSRRPVSTSTTTIEVGLHRP
ncbi:tetratricopeptide repeat protein [Plantactinospora sp. S1510]|uniref:Tetratricopeptide repeat protein n=1 Tax=Plantactinospora alkalitolerans TaxID=2789879 RepID=A0ABS0GTV3_9ACTN|nr:BTAD domain-containing putative transcriptional regulator [Plantactinospora alkalitolerans]MBF9129633.1 tetratricopeptide repeat protein [Plantactinospora alkalitolerans]